MKEMDAWNDSIRGIIGKQSGSVGMSSLKFGSGLVSRPTRTEAQALLRRMR